MVTTIDVTIRGGNLPYGIWTYDGAQFALTGGFLNSLDAYGSSRATVSGGSIYGLLSPYQTSTITLMGSAFKVDGSAVV